MTLNPFTAISNYYAKTADNFGSSAKPHLEHLSQGARAKANYGSGVTNNYASHGSAEEGKQALQTSTHAEIREWLKDPNSRGITL